MIRGITMFSDTRNTLHIIKLSKLRDYHILKYEIYQTTF